MAFTPTHSVIGLGGTFDHFHKGHEKFLQFAGQLANKLVVGVTIDKLVINKEASLTIEPFHKRNNSVVTFCKAQEIVVETVPLLDAFGPTITKSDIRGLCVTTATIPGAQAINNLRAKLGMRDLPVYICQLEKDIHGGTISSTRIRRGEIDRTGFCFKDAFSQELTLTSQQRAFFAKPLGEVVTQPTELKLNQAPAIVVVGDIALQQFREHRWHYDLGVYDLRSGRKEFLAHSDLIPTEHISNTAGSITPDATKLASLFASILDDQAQHLVKVTGEEDLLGIASILLAPLGSVVYYGQPEVGLVEVTVTPQLKWQFLKELNVVSAS